MCEGSNPKICLKSFKINHFFLHIHKWNKMKYCARSLKMQYARHGTISTCLFNFNRGWREVCVDAAKPSACYCTYISLSFLRLHTNGNKKNTFYY